MNESQKYLKEAFKHLQLADHLMYVTLPIVKEKRLLIKILEEIYKAIINSIYALFYYNNESINVKISETEDTINNFFKIANKYPFTSKQIKTIKEIIEIFDEHKKSVMEFVKKEKVVIMSDKLKTKLLDIITLKDYLYTLKEFLVILSKETNGSKNNKEKIKENY